MQKRLSLECVSMVIEPARPWRRTCDSSCLACCLSCAQPPPVEDMAYVEAYEGRALDDLRTALLPHVSIEGDAQCVTKGAANGSWSE